MAIFKLSSILKNSSALGSFNCIFENNSLKALFGQNMKKLKILKLSQDSRYLQKLALKFLRANRAQVKFCEQLKILMDHSSPLILYQAYNFITFYFRTALTIREF